MTCRTVDITSNECALEDSVDIGDNGRHSPAKAFTHLVLTKFNVDTPYAPSARGIEPLWLKARFELFLRYCYPSVTRQEGVEFRWFIFCNILSPDWFKKEMSRLNDVVIPVFVEGLATDEVLGQKVMEAGVVHTPYVITTRIDNDDAISRRHLWHVQRAFRRQEREFIAFPLGLQLFRGHLYSVYYPCNPFLSLIERVSDNGRATTVFCVSHTKVRTAGKVRHLWKSPQWLQVLHSQNIENSLMGWPRLRSKMHSEFHLSWPDNSSSDTLFQRVKFSMSRPVGRVSGFVARTVRQWGSDDSKVVQRENLTKS